MKRKIIIKIIVCTGWWTWRQRCSMQTSSSGNTSPFYLSSSWVISLFFYYSYLTVVEDIVIIIENGGHCNWWWLLRCCAGCLREVWVSTSLREQQSRSIKVFTFTVTFTLTFTFNFTWKSNRVRDDMKYMVRSCSCLRFGIGLIISLKVFMVGRDVQLKHIIVRTQ